MSEERTLSSKLVFQGRAVSVRVDTVQTARGEQSTREIVVHPHCITVVALDNEENILLVRQYRKAVEKELLELPAGGIEPGETPEDAVKREMREETGYFPAKVVRLGGFYSSPGFCTEYLHLYLATGLTYSPLSAEDTAGITVVKLKPQQILDFIFSETTQDSKSIAGLLLYMEYRKQH